jgi:low affinity Fe/Cu permease
MNKWFARSARKVSNAAGSPWAFLVAFSSIIIWLVVGFFVGFSDTHQLIINTGTTIITFLMVFLIQNSQNHDTAALHLKLDEIIRSLDNARNEIAAAEDMEPDELKRRLEEERKT